MVFSCAGNKKTEEVETVDNMYSKAIQKLQDGKYKSAVDTFADLERNYPYSKWAVKGQLVSAYASYKDEEFDDALITLERFIKLHPGHEDIDYAYYLRALSFYEQISDVKRDQSYTGYAKSTLNEVVVRFPNTKYAQDAQIKLDLVNDHLAGKEVEIGRFYLRQGSYIAAINRFQRVLEDYQTTMHAQEALHRLVETNLALGIKSEAQKYAAVLGYNYPDSKWYKKSYRLIEGKKLADAENKTKGKWYDFSNWKGRVLRKSKTEGMEDRSRELVEKLNVNRNVEGTEIGQIPTATDSEKHIKKHKKETKGGLKQWWKSIKKPFKRNKD